MDSQWLILQFQLNPERTKADLARALGLEPSAISKILNGTRQIKAQEYHGMRRFFGLPTYGTKGSGRGPEQNYVLEPLRTANALHDSRHDSESDHGQWIIPAEIMEHRTQSPSTQIKVFTVEDTMMEPAFKRGEPVLVDLSDKRPSPSGTFVISDGFGYIIRHCAFVAHSAPPVIEVSHTNGQNGLTLEHHPMKDLSLIGRVIAKLQWL